MLEVRVLDPLSLPSFASRTVNLDIDPTATGFASQAEAEGGTAVDKLLSPLRGKQQFAAELTDAVATQVEVEGLTDNAKVVTPLGLAYYGRYPISGVVSITAGNIADAADILETIKNPSTVVTFDDGQHLVETGSEIKIRTPMVIQSATQSGMHMHAAFKLVAPGETVIRRMILWPAFNATFEAMFSVYAGRLSLDDVIVDGDGGGTDPAMSFLQGHSPVALMLRANSITAGLTVARDLVIDWTNCRDNGTAIVDARYANYCWFAGSGANRVIIKTGAHATLKATDIIAAAGCDGYMSDCYLEGSGKTDTNTMAGLTVDRSGDWLVTVTGESLPVGFKDLAQGISSRGSSHVHVTAGVTTSSPPVALTVKFENLQKGMQETSGGRITFDENKVAFTNVDSPYPNDNLLRKFVSVAGMASKHYGNSGAATIKLSPAYSFHDITNTGAFTLSPHDTEKGAYTVEIVNGASAGSPTLTGWTETLWLDGGTFDTTNGSKFVGVARIGNTTSTLHLTKVA